MAPLSLCCCCSSEGPLLLLLLLDGQKTLLPRHAEIFIAFEAGAALRGEPSGPRTRSGWDSDAGGSQGGAAAGPPPLQ